MVRTTGEYFQLAQHPYGECMIDAHRVDVQATLIFQTPLGPMPRELISRMWLRGGRLHYKELRCSDRVQLEL